MRLTTPRVGHRQLVLLATLVTALTTLAACGDEQPTTAPSTHPNAPGAAADVSPTAEDDSTRLTITLDRSTPVYPDGNGIALINGTLTCSRAGNEEVALYVRVQQKQPGRVVGDGYAERRLVCSTTEQQRWGVYVYPASGFFDAGKANASVRVLDPAPGVVPATASENVRLYP
jgi:hypothetical protein